MNKKLTIELTHDEMIQELKQVYISRLHAHELDSIEVVIIGRPPTLEQPFPKAVIDCLKSGNMVSAVTTLKKDWDLSLLDAKKLCELYRYVVFDGQRPYFVTSKVH
jgi:hypothetical protein